MSTSTTAPELPKGWRWTRDGAASSTALVRITERGLVRVEGEVHEAVMAAVMHKRARGEL